MDINQLAARIQAGDLFYFQTDHRALYPAFGIKKLVIMNQLRPQHHSQNIARLGHLIGQMASLTANAKEKEGDWAIMGGIAQGIGGLGAGIAAAAQTQMQNMEIRQRNAQRDQQAAAFRFASGNVAQMVGNFPPKLALTPEELSSICVRTAESTRSLFHRLRITWDIPPLKMNTDLPKPLYYNFDDHGDKTQSIKLTFNSQGTHRIDGYLRMTMRDGKGNSLWVKIIPLPLMGVGRSNNSTLSLPLPYAVRSLSFEPLALWELTDDSCQDAVPALEPTDMPEGDTLRAAWKANEEAFDRSNEQLARTRSKRRCLLIASCIAAVVAVGLLMALFISSENDKRNFKWGRSNLSFSSASAQSYFSQLPDSWHADIAQEYIRYIDRNIESHHNFGWDEGKSYLTSAASYANEEQLAVLATQSIRIGIMANEPGVAKAAIEAAYADGYITAEQLTGYAQEMYEFDSLYLGLSAMQEDAVAVLALVKDEYADAATLHDQYSSQLNGYDEAVAAFYARDYEPVVAFFAENPDTEYADEYLGMAKGALMLHGTWRGPGVELVISDNLEVPIRKVVGDKPWAIYLRLLLNGEDITHTFTGEKIDRDIICIQYQVFGDYDFDISMGHNVGISPQSCLYLLGMGADNQLELTFKEEDSDNVLRTVTLTKAD